MPETDTAFREFVTSSSPTLLRAAWLLAGDEALARDLVQAAWERTWKRWELVTAADEPLAYVRAVMTSIYLTWRRRRWWGEIPTSAELGCSVGSVKGHASRALRQLRACHELDGLWHPEVIDDRR